MHYKASFLCSREAANGPYPEPDESRPTCHCPQWDDIASDCCGSKIHLTFIIGMGSVNYEMQSD